MSMLMRILFMVVFASHMSVYGASFDVEASIEDFDAPLEKPFYEDHARGWHWYEAGMIPAPDDKKIHQKSKASLVPETSNVQYPATEDLKKYQAEFEEVKAVAVMNPTPQNVFNYQRMQYQMTQKAGRFAEVWMQNVYKNPNIDYTQVSPVSQNARHIYLAEQRKKIEEKIHKLSQRYGLFFFFKNECAYCDAFAPVVQRFSEKYDWDVLAISEFGESHSTFKRSVQDNGLAETWGVNTYPSLFAVDPKSGHVIPVAVGMISIQEMEERITSIMNDENGAAND